MILVLLGYMGSGKSVVGKQLAHVLDYTFYDLDQYIEEKEQSTIADIFKTKGEIYFRKKEHYVLNELLNRDENIVLSLGGGTPCYGNNMDLITNSNNAVSFYLKASIPVLAQRLKNEKNKRPLISHLKTDDEIIEFIGKHLFERSSFYAQSSYTLLTDDKNITEIVEGIILELV